MNNSDKIIIKYKMKDEQNIYHEYMKNDFNLQ